MSALKDRPAANGRPLPACLTSADNERVVGAIIAAFDSAAAFAKASTYVSSADFVDPMAGAAFEAMAEIVADRGDPGDVRELARRLKASGDLDNTLSIAGIAEQLHSAPSSVNLHFAAAEVKRAAERLSLQYTLDAAQASIRDRGDPIAVASRLRDDVDGLCRRDAGGRSAARPRRNGFLAGDLPNRLRRRRRIGRAATDDLGGAAKDVENDARPGDGGGNRRGPSLSRGV